MRNAAVNYLRRVVPEQWPLLLVLLGFLVIGSYWVFSYGQSKQDILFNLGIELLGTAISVLMIEFAVSRYLENREASRLRPIHEVVVRQIEKHTVNMEIQLGWIGLDLSNDFSSAEQLGKALKPTQLEEKMEVIPGHHVRSILHFQASASWSRKYLRDIFEINRPDLPPEMASAILSIVYIDSQQWGQLATVDPAIDDFILNIQELVCEHFNGVKKLRACLYEMKRELGL